MYISSMSLEVSNIRNIARHVLNGAANHRKESFLSPNASQIGTDHHNSPSPLVNTINSIPISTAECERGLSQMNLVLTPTRASLQIKTLNTLMFIKLVGPPLHVFRPLSYANSLFLKGRHLATETKSKERAREDGSTSVMSSEAISNFGVPNVWTQDGVIIVKEGESKKNNPPDNSAKEVVCEYVNKVNITKEVDNEITTLEFNINGDITHVEVPTDMAQGEAVKDVVKQLMQQSNNNNNLNPTDMEFPAGDDNCDGAAAASFQ
ncbi:hypothetical protein ANN_26029 [Periplaneta americana]|uniref:HAT C-terminal dimerisation domain-containing protein n=1 Tax=Periplaneta americana TaxID=6978 RepID=A0ABQ8S530_PERAM|nr:hypothetical protein ANN_26029 [Periplaneta americana]